jgi:hypothetical protein
MSLQQRRVTRRGAKSLSLSAYQLEMDKTTLDYSITQAEIRMQSARKIFEPLRRFSVQLCAKRS